MEKELTTKAKIIKIIGQLNLKKDGVNKLAYFKYFTPKAIFQNVLPLLEENNLFMKFDLIFKQEKNMYEGILTIESLDNAEDIVRYQFDILLTIIKGASAGQNAGGTMTYAKRYSIMNAFHIAENESDLDSNKVEVKKEDVKKVDVEKLKEKIRNIEVTEQAKLAEEYIADLGLTEKEKKELRDELDKVIGKQKLNL